MGGARILTKHQGTDPKPEQDLVAHCGTPGPHRLKQGGGSGADPGAGSREDLEELTLIKTVSGLSSVVSLWRFAGLIGLRSPAALTLCRVDRFTVPGCPTA